MDVQANHGRVRALWRVPQHGSGGNSGKGTFLQQIHTSRLLIFSFRSIQYQWVELGHDTHHAMHLDDWQRPRLNTSPQADEGRDPEQHPAGHDSTGDKPIAWRDRRELESELTQTGTWKSFAYATVHLGRPSSVSRYLKVLSIMLC